MELSSRLFADLVCDELKSRNFQAWRHGGGVDGYRSGRLKIFNVSVWLSGDVVSLRAVYGVSSRNWRFDASDGAGCERVLRELVEFLCDG